MDSFAIFGAKYLIFIALAVAGFYFLGLPWQKKKEVIIFGVITLSMVYIVAKIVAMLYYDPRPFVTGHFTPLIPHEPDNGFPSDHALLISSIAAILFPFNKRIAIGIFILALVVGASRVYVGIHNPIDILGSAIIALGTGLLGYYVSQKIGERKQNP